MKKAMTIAYPVGRGLYINMTNRCSNACRFCIRQNGDGAYESDSLWLEHEPSVDEVMGALGAYDLSRMQELVFCGYGEPTYRLYDIVTLVGRIKTVAPTLPIRLNTNGQSDRILGVDTAPLYAGVFDVVSISLNAPTEEGYNALCLPRFGAGTLDSILSLAQRLKAYVPTVCFSVVRQFLGEEDLSACRSLSERMGIPLRVREYES